MRGIHRSLVDSAHKRPIILTRCFMCLDGKNCLKLHFKITVLKLVPLSPLSSIHYIYYSSWILNLKIPMTVILWAIVSEIDLHFNLVTIPMCVLHLHIMHLVIPFNKGGVFLFCALRKLFIHHQSFKWQFHTMELLYTAVYYYIE